MGKAKGTAVVDIVKYLRKHREDALRVLPPALHPYLSERITLSSWYPEEDMLGLIRAMLRLVPGREEATLTWMGTATARSHQKGVYSHLLKEGASSAAASSALWSSQHDTGRLSLLREARGALRIDLVDYALPSREMCAIIGAYMAETLRIGGVEDVSTEELSCRVEGHERCSWRFTWLQRREPPAA
jgi:hypothetical protein